MDRRRVVLMFEGEAGKTKCMKSFAKAADINNIMKKYKQTGLLVDPSILKDRQPYYGDFSSGTDFLDVVNKITIVKNIFNRLSSDLRNRFQNDPANFIDFVNDPKNLDECIKLKLLPKEFSPKFKADKIEADTANPPTADPAKPEEVAK